MLVEYDASDTSSDCGLHRLRSPLNVSHTHAPDARVVASTQKTNAAKARPVRRLEGLGRSIEISIG